MRLREWRRTHNMTLQQCADAFGLKHARNFQRYEIGEILPDAPFVAALHHFTAGEVTAADVYEQRQVWLNRQNSSAQTAEAAE